MRHATRSAGRFLYRAWAGLRDERGQTMAEYAILVAVIALVVVVAAVVFGSSLSALFHNSSAKV